MDSYSDKSVSYVCLVSPPVPGIYWNLFSPRWRTDLRSSQATNKSDAPPLSLWRRLLGPEVAPIVIVGRRERERRRLRQFLFPHRPLNLRDASGKVMRGCVGPARYLRNLCSVSGGHVACEIASATQDDHGALGGSCKAARFQRKINLHFAT